MINLAVRIIKGLNFILQGIFPNPVIICWGWNNRKNGFVMQEPEICGKLSKPWTVTQLQSFSQPQPENEFQNRCRAGSRDCRRSKEFYCSECFLDSAFSLVFKHCSSGVSVESVQLVGCCWGRTDPNQPIRDSNLRLFYREQAWHPPLPWKQANPLAVVSL